MNSVSLRYLITAGSKIIVPPAPELSIFTTCSDPCDNPIFSKAATGLEGIAIATWTFDVQSSPATQTEPTGAILFSIACSAWEEWAGKKKINVRKINIFFV